MTRTEWIAYHDKQAKHHGETDLFFEKKCAELFDPNHGLIQYDIINNEMVLLEIIGHLFYWREVILDIAKNYGYEKIVSYHHTTKPKRLERLYGMTAIPIGNDTYKFIREV